MTARIIPLHPRVHKAKPDHDWCAEPCSWEAAPGVVVFTIGHGDDARERFLPPAQARFWADTFAAMAEAAERKERQGR